MYTFCVIYGKFSVAYIKSLNIFTYKLSRSQLFEGSAFRLASCYRLWVLLVQFKNII
jgi:hypothetical protein